MTTTKADEYHGLTSMKTIPFDPKETECRVFAFASEKGFKIAFTTKLVGCTDAEYLLKGTSDKKKRNYKLNQKAYNYLILSCERMAFGIVEVAKTTKFPDGEVFRTWNDLSDEYESKTDMDLVDLLTNFNQCIMKDFSDDPTQ